MVAGRASAGGFEVQSRAGRLPRIVEFPLQAADRFPQVSNASNADELARMGETVTIQKNWQELIRPNKLQVAAGGDGNRFATLVAEPLERGFGQTLGNALRRILL